MSYIPSTTAPKCTSTQATDTASKTLQRCSFTQGNETGCIGNLRFVAIKQPSIQSKDSLHGGKTENKLTEHLANQEINSTRHRVLVITGTKEEEEAVTWHSSTPECPFGWHNCVLPHLACSHMLRSAHLQHSASLVSDSGWSVHSDSHFCRGEGDSIKGQVNNNK